MNFASHTASLATGYRELSHVLWKCTRRGPELAAGKERERIKVKFFFPIPPAQPAAEDKKKNARQDPSSKFYRIQKELKEKEVFQEPSSLHLSTSSSASISTRIAKTELDENLDESDKAELLLPQIIQKIYKIYNVSFNV
ncbi:hypothetical protein CDAR_404221 [Caerostris darwini]|uniref:Uncharacterized protein n=1 Tax=Caerostris darwini TaxID=1538125 RepID=A0AAV4STE1_9ARAC|nr:hypothetical protein CDAR_404221 [Caerostris darwini]